MDSNEKQSDGGRMERIGERTRQAAERTREEMAARASGLAEASRDTADQAREKLGRAAEIVKNAEPDEHLRETVRGTTQNSMHRAGDSLGRAAPKIGRGAESAAVKAGAALHKVARPLSAILGAIAATVGGWWKQASAGDPSLPKPADEACRAHFATLSGIPTGVTFERARPGYALGFLAGQNPDYRGRPFDEVEGDLRTGFSSDTPEEYEALREFVRFGYGRATA
ncbi:MAG: hypothetical protein WD737_14845 [Gemmatimonadota bacterium]